MSSMATFRLTLHASHPAIAAPEIVATFKFPVRYSYSAGEPKKTAGRLPIKGTHDRTHVSFSLHDKPLSFAEHSLVDSILGTVGSLDNTYLKDFRRSGGEVYFLIGVFSSDNVMFEFCPSCSAPHSHLNFSQVPHHTI